MYGLDTDFMLPNPAASYAARNANAGFMPFMMEDDHLARQSLSGLDRQFHPSPAAFNNPTHTTQEDSVSYLRREQFRLELMMRKLLKDHQALTSSSHASERTDRLPSGLIDCLASGRPVQLTNGVLDRLPDRLPTTRRASGMPAQLTGGISDRRADGLPTRLAARHYAPHEEEMLHQKKTIYNNTSVNTQLDGTLTKELPQNSHVPLQMLEHIHENATMNPLLYSIAASSNHVPFYPGRSNIDERSSAYGLNPLAASFSRQSHLREGAALNGPNSFREAAGGTPYRQQQSTQQGGGNGQFDGRSSATVHHCKICDKLMNSRTSYESHLNGKPHKMRLLSLRARSGQRGNGSDGGPIGVGPFGGNVGPRHGGICMTINSGGTGRSDTARSTRSSNATSIAQGGIVAGSPKNLASQSNPGASKPTSKLPYQCDVCNIWVSSAVNLRDHLAGSKHRKRVLARQNSKHPINGASNLRSGCQECASGKMWLCEACGNANYEWRKRCNMNFCREPKRADHRHCDPADAKVIVRKSATKPVKKYQVVTCKPGSLGANGKWNSGRIVEVKPGGQFKALGVRVGWTIEKINDLPYSEDMLDAVLGGTEDFILTFRVPTPSSAVVAKPSNSNAKSSRRPQISKNNPSQNPLMQRSSGRLQSAGGMPDTQCNLWSDLCHSSVAGESAKQPDVSHAIASATQGALASDAEPSAPKSKSANTGLDEGRGRGLEKLSSASGSTSPPPPASVRSENYMFKGGMMNSVNSDSASTKAPAKPPAPTNPDVEVIGTHGTGLSQWAKRISQASAAPPASGSSLVGGSAAFIGQRQVVKMATARKSSAGPAQRDIGLIAMANFEALTKPAAEKQQQQPPRQERPKRNSNSNGGSRRKNPKAVSSAGTSSQAGSSGSGGSDKAKSTSPSSPPAEANEAEDKAAGAPEPTSVPKPTKPGSSPAANEKQDANDQSYPQKSQSALLLPSRTASQVGKKHFRLNPPGEVASTVSHTTMSPEDLQKYAKIKQLARNNILSNKGY